jgi:hypothetical protein
MDTCHDRSKLFTSGADTHRSISHINYDADRDCDGYNNSDCIAIAYNISTL